MVGTATEHRCLRLTPGLLLTLLLAVDCHALFRPVERGPCQAKNPFGPGFSDGVCMPMGKCKETLHGIFRLNFPVVCGFELLSPIVCCPIMNGPAGHGSRESRAPNPLGFLGGIFGNVPGSTNPGPGAGGPFGPYGLNIPGVNSFEDYLDFLGFLPPGQGVGGHNGGGPVHQGFPQDYGKHTGNGQGQHPGVGPHQPDSFGGQNGRPLPGNQGPNTGLRHPDSFAGHNGRPGTGDQGHSSGVEPHNQGSPGGHGRPTRGGQGQGAGSPPQHQGSQGSHKMPKPTDQGKAMAGQPCRQKECPPQDPDDYIHLIDPRSGKP
uniref:Putative secreted protein n=1 Tax=Ixodes ricinus TaxID=34613 RepID=A0A6B0V7J8_IXORI